MLTEQARFDAALTMVLLHEGGYVDHPEDPGGATNLGITLATAKAAGLDKDGDGDVDKRDVRLLEPKDAAPVYRERYWNAARCGVLPAGVDFLVFDCAVNQGVARAARILQAAAGAAVDGQVGPRTVAAVWAVDPVTLCERIRLERLKHYMGLRTWPTFGRGWSRRLSTVSETAKAWARRSVRAGAVRP